MPVGRLRRPGGARDQQRSVPDNGDWHAHRYGPSPEQYGELWLPEGPGPHPVVVVVHGGFWRRRYACDVMHPLATALRACGLAAWNIEYRRVGSPGGGWPGTLVDAATAVDHLAVLEPPLDLDRVGIIGHSAGGHLSIWLAGRASLRGSQPGARPRVLPRAAVSLAGVLDLTAAAHDGLGGGAAVELLGDQPEAVPERYRVASPAERLPVGTPHLLVHGDRDPTVPLRYSRRHWEQASCAGDEVTLAVQPGSGHFEVLDPGHPAGRVGIDWLGARLGAPASA